MVREAPPGLPSPLFFTNEKLRPREAKLLAQKSLTQPVSLCGLATLLSPTPAIHSLPCWALPVGASEEALSPRL